MSNLKATQPIGIFDSGIGGLTVANAIVKHLPNEEIIYFGDTAHLPYGDKSPDTIRYYCLKIVKFLLEKNCKMIVIACNSASSAGKKVLLDFFEEHAIFVNVIDPLVEMVGQHHFKKVGVIATKATIGSGTYERELKSINPDLKVSSLATPLLAPMIEEGYVQNNISKAIIDNYLSDESLENIDALLLACTHYPLIRPEIEAYFNNTVEVFDSNDAVAKSVKQLLTKHQLLNDKRRNEHHFFISDYTASFAETTSVFYPEKIKLEYSPIW